MPNKPPNNLEQEILKALNSEPEFEKVPSLKLSPFNDPVAETPHVKNKAYFTEFCNWLSNGYQQLFHEAHTEEDYTARYAIFPPEQFPEPDNVYKQTWEPISEKELELLSEPAKKRLFDKSPQHHIFLISILEAIKTDTGKFIETYARRTNRQLELKEATGVQKCLESLIQELEGYLESEGPQLISVLYHHRDHGLMMSIDGYKLDVEEDEPIFEFGFSKTSSDSFTGKVIHLLKEKLNAISNQNPIPFKSGEALNLTEKALILSYLQEANEFISSDEQVRVNELVALLLGVSSESIKKAFQRVHQIKTGTLTSQEAKAKLKNLQRILPVFQRLELPGMVARIESRIKKVQTFIK